MITIEIPGWGNVEVESIIMDLNGTIATDGKIPSKVRERINALSEKVSVYVLTVDTHGTADEEAKDLNVEFVKIPAEESKQGKAEFLKTLRPETTVAIGNGSNDELIFKEAGLAIAVIGDEGMSVSAMKHADLVVKDILNALDFFLKPKRLIGSLRE